VLECAQPSFIPVVSEEIGFRRSKSRGRGLLAPLGILTCWLSDKVCKFKRDVEVLPKAPSSHPVPKFDVRASRKRDSSGTLIYKFHEATFKLGSVIQKD